MTCTRIKKKKMVQVPQDIVGILGKSKNAFVANLPFSVEEKSPEKAPRRGKKKITTLTKFKSSLDSLMKILTQCDLHYVRCLKPNFALVPGLFFSLFCFM